MKMKNKSKRVVVAFHLAGEPGRRKLSGFLRYINEHSANWQLQFVRTQEDFTAELVHSFSERGIDGIAYSIPTAKEGASELGKLSIPTIAMDIFDSDILKGRQRNLVYITASPTETGQDAARHFLSQGLHKSYGFVSDLKGNTWGKLRGKAFIDEIKANGFPVSRYTVRGKGYDLPHLANWLVNLPKPAAVFAAFDDRAIQILDACHDARLEVPHDVAIIGVDNDEMLCTNTTPPLTSIQPDHDKIGYLAAEHLAEMMSGRELTRPRHITVGTKSIVVRESTSPISPSGRLVQRALAFIRTNSSQAIKPKDVAAYLKVSRSLADLRFRELLKESIGETILRYRLNEVRHRLISTNDTIDNIAADCKFSKVSRLNASFFKAYGISMRDYRSATKAERTKRTI